MNPDKYTTSDLPTGRSLFWRERFHNIEPTPKQGWRELLRWKQESGWRGPDGKRFPLAPRADHHIAQPGELPQLTWIGHASFLFQHAGVNLLTDPVFSARCSPFRFAGPKRFTPPALTVDELPDIQLVVISHNHYDHLDEASIKHLYQRFGETVQFLVPLGLARWFHKRGIYQVREMDWWQSVSLPGVQATFVPAQHFSGRGVRDINKTLWGGWWLNSAGHKLFFAGDTGYGHVFGQIRAQLGAPDLALLPIGAYAPRWVMQSVHVNPEEAVQIHCDLDAKQSVAMHWGTFVLTDEPMDEPPIRLAQALERRGLPADCFVTLQHGETRIIST